MAVCPNCGQENLDGLPQCSLCGYPLGTSTASPDAGPSPDLPPPPSRYSLPPGYLPPSGSQQPPEIQLPPGHPEYHPPPGYTPSQADASSHGLTPVPLPARPIPLRNTGQFFAGLALGLIPSVLGLIVMGVALNGVGTENGKVGSGYPRLQAGEFALCMEGVFFIFFLAGAITLMGHPDRRFWGYGMLAGVLISPVVFFVSCAALIANYR